MADNFITAKDWLLPQIRKELLFSRHCGDCESLFDDETPATKACSYLREKHNGWNIEAMGHFLHIIENPSMKPATDLYEATTMTSAHFSSMSKKSSSFGKMVSDIDSELAE